MEGYTCPYMDQCWRIKDLRSSEAIIRKKMSHLLYANEVLLTNKSLDENLRYEFIENMNKYNALEEVLQEITDGQRC